MLHNQIQSERPYMCSCSSMKKTNLHGYMTTQGVVNRSWIDEKVNLFEQVKFFTSKIVKHGTKTDNIEP